MDTAGDVSLFSGIIALGSTHSGLAFDKTGMFGYDLIVTGSNGMVFRMDKNGISTFIANVGTMVESPLVGPPSFAPYGGHILMAAEGAGAVYAVSPPPAYAVSVVAAWPGAEAVHVVPDHGCSYGGAGSPFFAAAYPTHVQQFPAANFAGLPWAPEGGDATARGAASVRGRVADA